MATDLQKCRELLALEDGLSKWEIDFLDSIYGRLTAPPPLPLTEKQAATLNQIWERH